MQAAQKEQPKLIKVREYRKKTGTTVAAHERSEAAEKPQAYIQLFCDYSVIATAYTSNIMADEIEDGSEFEICGVDAGFPDDADEQECTEIGESLIPELLNKLAKLGYSRKFHRLEDI